MVARRLLIIIAVLVVGGAIGFVTTKSDREPTTSPTAQPSVSPPPCKSVPARIGAPPTWIPKDLPLPKATYLFQELDDVAGTHWTALIVKATLDEFVTYVLREWPADGWAIGKGDREPGEAESTFTKGKVIGQFRARDGLCVRDRIEVLLLIADKDELAGP